MKIICQNSQTKEIFGNFVDKMKHQKGNGKEVSFSLNRSCFFDMIGPWQRVCAENKKE